LGLFGVVSITLIHASDYMTKEPKRKNLKPPGKCIFCGDRGVTGEHIFSEWMHPFFDLTQSSNVLALGHIQLIEGEYVRSESYTKPRIGSIFTKRLKVVCGKHDDTTKCNGSWMSQMEIAAKPSLIPLLQAEKIILDANAQKSLAFWIAVKTIVAEYFLPKKVAIPAAERKFVWENKKPPSSNWAIWLARYDGEAFKPAVWRHHAWRLTWMPPGTQGLLPRSAINDAVVSNTQSTTFVIGRLFIHVISSAEAGAVGGFSGPIGNKLIRLWPTPKGGFLKLSAQPIQWPPPDGLLDDEVKFVADAFFNSAAGISDMPPAE
jgi:hypothetical protein